MTGLYEGSSSLISGGFGLDGGCDRDKGEGVIIKQTKRKWAYSISTN